MSSRAYVSLATILVAALVPACQDTTGSGTGFVVTGHIENRTQAALPANTRLIAVWGVTSGSPDYSYVFGEGTINRLTGTFRIRFDQPPPPAALNSGELGVAFIVATTNQSVKDGDVITSATQLATPIGITAQHAVIFVASHQQGVQLPAWVDAFAPGYSVGVGVKTTGIFDAFQPASASSLLLIVDDLANIEIVNWT